MQLELKNLQRGLGITFIYVTHDQEEALTMSDRVIIVKDGRIEQDDPPAAIYQISPRASLPQALLVKTTSLTLKAMRTTSLP